MAWKKKKTTSAIRALIHLSCVTACHFERFSNSETGLHPFGGRAGRTEGPATSRLPLPGGGEGRAEISVGLGCLSHQLQFALVMGRIKLGSRVSGEMSAALITCTNHTGLNLALEEHGLSQTTHCSSPRHVHLHGQGPGPPRPHSTGAGLRHQQRCGAHTHCHLLSS